MSFSDRFRRFLWDSGFLFPAMLAFFAASGERLPAQIAALTPEEISGVSIREIDGIHQMSRDYAVSPDGEPVPEDPDDRWLPDMSLGGTETNKLNVKKSSLNAQSSQNGQSVQTTRAQFVPQKTVHTSYSALRSNSESGSNLQLGEWQDSAPLAPVDFSASDRGISALSSANAANQSAPAQSAVQTQAAAQTQAAQPIQAVPPVSSGVNEGFTHYDSGFIVGGGSTLGAATSEVSSYDTGFRVSAAAQAPLPEAPVIDNALLSAPNSAERLLAPPAPLPVPAETADPEPMALPPAFPMPGQAAVENPTVPEAPAAPETPAKSETAAPDNAMSDNAALENATPDSAAIDPENLLVADIRCSEGLEMPIHRFNQLIKTKIGSNFSQQRLEEDKRALLQTKQYVDVIVSTTLVPDDPEKVIVNFDFTPRRQMKYIKVIGNKKLSKTEILEELNMKRGESRMDPYDVENGRIRIIELYKAKEYSEPHVDILKGNRPEDVGVVYLIDEGVKQRIARTTFVGNRVVSSAVLKHQISSKPGVLYIIGGDFSRERLDEDINKLLEYYRNLGYFDAKIDREFEEGEGYTGFGRENAWIKLKFIIDEGPQYKIRNFLFQGNRVLATDELKNLLRVKPGDAFNFGELEGDRVKLADTYQNIGYVRAEITPTQIFTDEPGVIDIRYNIDENYRYRVRDIQIQYEGEESRTKASVVMNMLDIAPGQLLDGKKIRDSETTMRRSGYFNDKPSDGPLPSVAIVPQENNLYFSEDQRKLAENGVEKKKLKIKSGSPDKSKKEPILGAKPTEQTVKRPIGSEPEQRGETNKSSETADKPVIRGQLRDIPTGFSGVTTQPSASMSGSASAGAWNSGGYISYPAASTTQAGNPYSDASMYNGGSATGTAAGTAANVAPPLETGNPFDARQAAGAETQSSGLFTSTTMGADPSKPDYMAQASTVPGFNAAGAAGRDAVFPGTLEQQYLDNQLLGDNGEPIRDATVVAKIMEGRTGTFQASVGVNSNYGLIGNISFTERNFDILKWPTAFWRSDGWTDAFRGGGQIFRVEASPGTEFSRYSASWDVPYVFDTKYNFGVTGLYADRYYDEWYETRYGGEVRLGRQWTPRFSTTVTGGIYDVKIFRPSVSYIPDLNEVLGHNSLYTVGLSASYDTRNHPFMPSKGFVVSGGVNQVLGSFSYPQVTFDARSYFTLHKRADGSGRKVLGLRSAAGWTGDDTPIYDRYFGGGYANLRGFEYREVTPRYPGTNFGVGGNFEFYNSAELLVPVSGGDEFQLAFFIDTGTVSPKINDWDKYRVAPGFGVRLAIPMLGPAPLALDFAFPISKAEDDVKQVFSFSIVGSR